MRLRLLLYNFFLPLAWLILRLLSLFNTRISRAISVRKGIRKRWQTKLDNSGSPGTTIWFHVSSVGEFLQARPVMDLLENKYGSDLRIIITFYSPSGLEYYIKHDRMRKNPAVRFVDYLPFDTPGNARFCLDALKPQLIVYVKYDLWPNLLSAAACRNIPQVLISAAIPPRSKRFSGIPGWFMRTIFSSLTAIAAVSENEAVKLRSFTRNLTDILSSGDIRFDQVVQRIDSPSSSIPTAISDDPRKLLIAGSTWPEDESIIIPGFSRLIEMSYDTALVIVPHEPTPDRIASISNKLEHAGISFCLLSKIDEIQWPTIQVVIADGLGYLAELYAAGSIAYVGGAFTTGVHNIMEPAVSGLPVLFGPRHQNAWESEDLIRIGAAFEVSDPDQFTSVTERMLSDDSLLSAAGQAAENFIRSGTGSALRCTELFDRLIVESGRDSSVY
jgi:3-deoxy-D-manno-octulosonic-acid transferase